MEERAKLIEELVWEGFLCCGPAFPEAVYRELLESATVEQVAAILAGFHGWRVFVANEFLN